MGSVNPLRSGRWQARWKVAGVGRKRSFGTQLGATAFLASLNAAKTHCPKGHPYSAENSTTIRTCRRQLAKKETAA